MKTSSILPDISQSSHRLGKLASRKRIPTQNLEHLSLPKNTKVLNTNPSRDKIIDQVLEIADTEIQSSIISESEAINKDAEILVNPGNLQHEF